MRIHKPDIVGIILALVIVVVIIFLVKLGGLKVERDAAVEALNQTVESQKHVESIQGTARAEKRSEGLKSAARQQSLQKALQANKDWASTVTPPEVQQELLGALEGLE